MNYEKAKLVVSPTNAFLAHRINYFNDNELLDWAEEHAGLNCDVNSDSSLFQILWLNRKTVHRDARLGQLIESHALDFDPGFDIKGASAEIVARRLFEARLQAYLDEQCLPWDVCKMINPIEELFDFPSWLGDMYNLCDWIEPETQPVECRHLEHGIRKHLDRTGE